MISLSMHAGKPAFHALNKPIPLHPPGGTSSVHKPLSLCDQLNHTTSLLDLSLGLLAEPSCSYDDWNLWNSALAEDFGVSEWEEIEDGGGVGLLARNVCFARFFRDQ